MRQLLDFTRKVHLGVLAMLVLATSATMIGQQRPPAVPHPSTPPSGTASPLGSATNARTGMKLQVGTITGFVYWQMNVFQSSSTCQGLSLKAITVNKVGMPLQLLSTTNTLTAAGPMTDTSSPGTPKYMLCSYQFQNMPENVALRVLLYGAPSSESVSMPSSFQIPGGNCNSTPSGTLSFILTGGEMLCGNGAFNINFKLTSTAVAAPRPTTPSILLSQTPGSGGMLSQPQAAPANPTPAAPNPSGATLLLPNPGNSSGNASSATAPSGMLASPVKSGGAASTGGSGGFSGGVKQGTTPSQKLLTNADVIKMQKAGISESVIVQSIQSSIKQFDFSRTSLQALRQEHVSPKVLAAMCDGSARACPQDLGIIATASPGSKVALNPQPFPPRTSANAVVGTPGATVSLNPQPLPPKLDISKLRKGIVIKNPTLGSSAILRTLKLQKQSADLQAGQVLSAQVGSRASSTTTSPPVLTGGASGGSKATSLLIPTRLASTCPSGHTTISAVNQQASNLSRTTNTTYSPIVFTPDPAYNHYTIAGCGFGTTPGQIYLSAGRSGFPAHNGRVLLVPTNGQTWGNQWSDTFIDAQVDPTVSAEFDQDNVNLIVEPSTGTPAQASGFSFYAKRGSPIPMLGFPIADLAVGFDLGGARNDIGDAWYAPVTQAACWCVLGPAWMVVVNHYNATLRWTDKFTLNLAPGFIVDSARPDSVNQQAGAEVTVSNNTIQVTAATPPDGSYFLSVWVTGPAGITSPLPRRRSPIKLH